MAVCVLHNFLMKKGKSYCSNITFDSVNQTNQQINMNGEWRDNGIPLVGLQTTRRNSNLTAKQNRDKYATYFNGEGAVTWQEDTLRKGKA